MAKIAETFTFPDPDEVTQEELLRYLQEMYTILAVAINRKPDIYQRTVGGVPTDGSPTDTFLSQGDININTTTNKVEMLTNHLSPTLVTWTTLS
jgi:hypothetical protein